jgi:hypothetical protein
MATAKHTLMLMWSHDFPHDLKFETGFLLKFVLLNLPVPILVENEHLQIWQLLTALLAFFRVKTQPFTHCFYSE